MTECTISMERCGGQCTGYDGSAVWKEREQANAKITCDNCRGKAEKLEVFTHDIVNGRIGKKIFDKKNWDEHVQIVNCVNDSCKKEGRC
ncbi:MAG: hypothetical protein V3U54_13440 [Thermodesulfobacteriota bacterium]